ncbi:hypothetical protein JW823_09825 [bacterium]|nr:hypothetical protein [candidate division CSSED10-310 bacterium]
MACINPDGSLSAVALLMLDYLREPHTETDIVQRAAQPVYRIRSSLRELADSGLVELTGRYWSITARGTDILNQL